MGLLYVSSTIIEMYRYEWKQFSNQKNNIIAINMSNSYSFSIFVMIHNKFNVDQFCSIASKTITRSHKNELLFISDDDLSAFKQ